MNNKSGSERGEVLDKIGLIELHKELAALNEKNDFLQKLCEEQKSQLATQTERVNAQDAEIEKLRAFADHILQNYSWDNYCFEIDPADAQDKAEELGLIEKRDVNPDDYDGADWAYFTKWTPKEALNQDSLGDGK